MIRAPQTGYVDVSPLFQSVVAIAQGAPQKNIRASLAVKEAERVAAYSGKVDAQANALQAQATLEKKKAQNTLILAGAAGIALLAVTYLAMRS